MELGKKYQKVNEKFDASSITKYGAMPEDVEFSAIGDLPAMVDDVLDWVLLEKKELKKIVEFEAFWDAAILEQCDYFTVNAPLLSGLKYRTLKSIDRPQDQIIGMRGIQFVSAAPVDSGFLYYVLKTTPERLIKINLATFTRVGYIELDSPARISDYGAIDTANQMGYLLSGDESPGRLIKVNLSSFSVIDILTLSYGFMSQLLKDSASQFLYTARFYTSGRCIKINLSAFTEQGSISAYATSCNLAGTIDSQYAYFGIYSNPGYLQRVRLSDFTLQGYITFTAMGLGGGPGTIHPGLGYIYQAVSLNQNPGKIARIRTSDFTWINTLTLALGDVLQISSSAVTDTQNNFAYFSTIQYPSKIIKIDLSAFTRVGYIEIGDGSNNVSQLRIKESSGYLYAIGTGVAGTPARVYKIRLSDFTLVDMLEGITGENKTVVGSMIG